MIFTFNIDKDNSTDGMANRYKVGVRMHKLIYDLIKEIRFYLMANSIKDVSYFDEEFFTGILKVKEVFDIKFDGKKTKIAGIEVVEGKLNEKNLIRIINDDDIIGSNLHIASLRQDGVDKNLLKKSEIGAMILKDFDKITEGDLIQCYNAKEQELTVSNFKGCFTAF